MKLPRDIKGNDLVRMLAKVGYVITRQSGSHIRLTTEIDGEHHVTIPNHNPIKLGTLSAILNSVAEHFGISREQLMQRIL